MAVWNNLVPSNLFRGNLNALTAISPIWNRFNKPSSKPVDCYAPPFRMGCGTLSPRAMNRFRSKCSRPFIAFSKLMTKPWTNRP